MKKSFIFTLAFACAGAALGQATITSNHFVKTGERVKQYDSELSSKRAKLQGGSNITWDFSYLGKDDSTILDFYNANWKPSIAAKHPACNFLGHNPKDSSYFLLKSTSTEISTLGIYDYSVSGGSVFQEFSFPIAQFPLTMGSNLSSTPAVSNAHSALGIDPDGPGPVPKIDSISIDIVTTEKTKGIGFGSIKLPSGNMVNNCIMAEKLRIEETKNFKIFSNNVWSTPPQILLDLLELESTSDTSVSHQWLSTSPGYNFMVVEISLYEDSFEDVTYMDNKIASNSAQSIQKMAATVYPNPVKDILNVEGVFDATYTLINLNGQVVQSGKMQHNAISVNTLEKGVYTLQVNSNDGVLTQLFIKE